MAKGEVRYKLVLDGKDFKDEAVSISELMEAGFGLEAGREIFESFREVAEKTAEALGEVVVHGVEYAHGVEMMAAKTQMSTTATQEWMFAARAAGVDVEGLTAAAGKLEKNLGDGAAKTVAAANDLGLSYAKLRNESPDKALSDVAEAMSHVQNPTERAADAAALLGKGYQTLMPLINDLAELKQKAHDEGVIVDESDIAGAAKLGQNLRITSTIGESFVNVLGTTAANTKALDIVLNAANDTLGSMSRWVSANREEVRSWVADGVMLAVDGSLLLIHGMEAMAGVLKVGADGFTYLTLEGKATADMLTLVGELSAHPLKAVDAWATYKANVKKDLADADVALKAHQDTYSKLEPKLESVEGGLDKLHNKLLQVGSAQAVAADGAEKHSGAATELGAAYEATQKTVAAAVQQMEGIRARADEDLTKHVATQQALEDGHTKAYVEFVGKQADATNKAADELRKLDDEYAKTEDAVQKTGGSMDEVDDKYNQTRDAIIANRDALLKLNDTQFVAAERAKAAVQAGKDYTEISKLQVEGDRAVSEALGLQGSALYQTEMRLTDETAAKIQAAEATLVQRVAEEGLTDSTVDLSNAVHDYEIKLIASLGKKIEFEQHKSMVKGLQSAWGDVKSVLSDLGVQSNSTFGHVVGDIDKVINVAKSMNSLFKDLEGMLPAIEKLFGGIGDGASSAKSPLAGATTGFGELGAAIGGAASALGIFVGLQELLFGGFHKSFDTNDPAQVAWLQDWSKKHPGESFDDIAGQNEPNLTADGYKNQYGHPGGGPPAGTVPHAARGMVHTQPRLVQVHGDDSNPEVTAPVGAMLQSIGAGLAAAGGTGGGTDMRRVEQLLEQVLVAIAQPRPIMLDGIEVGRALNGLIRGNRLMVS